MAALLLAPSPFIAGERQVGDIDVMDPALREALIEARPGANMVVIVRFDRPVSDENRLLDRLGLTPDVVLDPINAASFTATREQVLALSRADGVVWIEEDAALDTFMEVSNVAIGSPSTWDHALIEDGEVVFDDDGYMKRIDGRGVTAVVLDTGIDAGHPDLDYGTKTIKNEKRTEAGWTEVENGDTSSGHGTHCAGTVAGNGDASAGQRRGVAPGANLYGMSTGEGLSIIYAVEALTRVYEQSRPNDNPMNIRVVSNSWGTSGARYDPQDAITLLIEKLSYENHVAVVFAAGNDGGDGSDIRTNPYANVPSAISVAAALRDGTGIADFSSRGHKDIEETWPDITAPGVDIWSTAPRGTLIDGSQRPTDDDLYYMAISGTSMATPHISGVVSLLYQAAPGLNVSGWHDDHSGGEGGVPASEWYNDTTTLVTEAELILKATADYIEPGAEGVPQIDAIGDIGKRHDFAQGYGLVNVTRAVQVALTLQRLRTYDGDGDGRADRPDLTVFDAMEQMNISYRTFLTVQTDNLRTRWHGEWAHLVTSDMHPSGNSIYATNSSVNVYMPQGADMASIVLDYEQSSLTGFVANLDLAIDMDGDGNNDVTTPTAVSEGVKRYEIEVSEDLTGQSWRFWIDGEAVGYIWQDNEFFEPTVNFQVSMAVHLSAGEVIVPLQSEQTETRWLEPGEPSGEGNCTLFLGTRAFDTTGLVPRPVKTITVKETDEVIPLGVLAAAVGIALAAGLAIGFSAFRKRKNAPVEVVPDAVASEPVPLEQGHAGGPASPQNGRPGTPPGRGG